MTVQPSRRLVAIDALRGVAVLAVVIAHLPFSMSLAADGPKTSALPEWMTEIAGYGGYGVNLFFVVSGFCIHMSWARSPTVPIRFFSFWKRRLHRLYPPYFVALLASLAGLFLFYGLHGGSLGARFGYTSTSAFVVDVVVLVLLLQNLNGASQRVGNGPFWSLAVEEQLYFLYFPLLWVRKRLGWPLTFAMVLAITLAWRVVASVPGSGFTTYHAPARWAEWVLGAIAVEAYLGRITLPAFLYSLPIGFVFVGLGLGAGWGVAYHPEWRTVVVSDFLLGVGFFVIINAACRARWGQDSDGKVARALAQVGVFSYSIYLVHEPIIVAAKQIGVRFGWSIPVIVFARLLFAVGGGYVFFLLVEKRFLNRPKPVK